MHGKITPQELSDRHLLASAVLNRSPHCVDYSATICILRYGRWGTCVDCPRVEGKIYPELCVHTDRYDHHIDVVKDGVFTLSNRLATRADVIALIQGPRTT